MTQAQIDEMVKFHRDGVAYFREELAKPGLTDEERELLQLALEDSQDEVRRWTRTSPYVVLDDSESDSRWST